MSSRDKSTKIENAKSISANIPKAPKKPAVEFDIGDEELDRVSGGLANTTGAPRTRAGDDWTRSG
jgi:hypothetical protein